MMKFGLIGFPVIHSFSKKYFTEKFENEGIDAVYDLFPLEKIDMFKELIATHTFKGLNVTIPHKQAVIPFLDELDATAAEIGAVNVIQFTRNDGILKLKGYNTDAIGFENSIKPLLKPHHRKALILGTGGASKAIDYALRKNGISTTFVSRRSNESRLSYNDLTNELVNLHTVIVNCTPLGMDPAVDGFPAIPYSAIGPDHLLYDVVYKPEETVFLKKGKAQGATTINGLDMLWGQAEAAWKIWNQF
jgi:shikimate dehydrogenase